MTHSEIMNKYKILYRYKGTTAVIGFEVAASKQDAIDLAFEKHSISFTEREYYFAKKQDN